MPKTISLAILVLGTTLAGLLIGGESPATQPAGKPTTQPANSAPRIVSIWGGAQTHMVMKSDGTVWTWGMNGMGQLGDGTTSNRCVPVQVVGPGGVGHLAPVSAIMGGEMHNFALKTDGTVWAWGNNMFGQLGNGEDVKFSAVPVQVSNLSSIISIGGRGYHSLAVKSDGTVWAWGWNSKGELGNGTAEKFSKVPLQVVGLTKPSVVSGGYQFSLALMPDGTVCQWGHGRAIGNSNAPVQIPEFSKVIAISAGWDHALALKSDGTVWAWGVNKVGELGDGSTVNRATPVQVKNLNNIISVSAGDWHSTALRSDGTVWKWGRNESGQLGQGRADKITDPHPVPLQVPGLSNVVMVSARDWHNLCVTKDGQAWVWGDNRSGCCGDFTGVNVLSPRLMPGLVPSAEKAPAQQQINNQKSE
jgi:alpha-tubulin suppressor-like RCC1 family protein